MRDAPYFPHLRCPDQVSNRELFKSGTHVSKQPFDSVANFSIFDKRKSGHQNARRVEQMDALLIAAAAGMKARTDSLDTIANNLANIATNGFKSQQDFYRIYGHDLPVVEGTWADSTQGTLLATGGMLDLALSGPGAFVVNGPAGQQLLTRSGTFRISAKNQLETGDGYALLDASNPGKALTVDPAQPLEIGRDGTVSQGGQTIGRIALAPVAAASGIHRLGRSYFALTSPQAPAASLKDTVVLQGYQEQSNVDPAASAVRLITVLRQFESLQRALNIGNQMNREAIQEVAKVG
jgi:flagellar basal-body rod protein FlgF